MFAKIWRVFISCLLIFWLVGCVNTPPETVDFNRSEAVKARINLALAYLEQHDFPKAKENIDKAFAHDKQDYLPYSVLAYYHQQIGESENAETTYRKAITLSKKQTTNQQPRPDVLNNYGTFLCKQRQFELAYAQFETALASQQPYYHQVDTLENIVLCARIADHREKYQTTLAQLEKIAPERAIRLGNLF